MINGAGTQTRDYVFVGDVVKASVLALSHQGSAIFNVGTGVETDVNTLFRELKKQTGSSCEEKHAEGKKGEQLRSVLNNGKIRQALGWTPTVPLAEGMRQTVAFFKGQTGRGA